MNFERNIEPKAALNIGRIDKATHVDFVLIKIKHPAESETLQKYHLEGDDLHHFLKIFASKKFPWEIYFKKFPLYEERIKSHELITGVLICLNRKKHKPSTPLVYQVERFWNLRGRDLYYDKKIYAIPPKEEWK